MRSWRCLQQNSKKRHFCDTHSGLSFFFECLKSPQCDVDWKTETSRCRDCDALLRPPKLLLLYNYFGVGWQKWFAFFLGDIIASKLGVVFPNNFLIMVSCYIVAGHFVPAVLAVFGTWASFSLPGLSQDEALERQRSTIEQRMSLPYQRAVRAVLFAVLALLAGYALALRK